MLTKEAEKQIAVKLAASKPLDVTIRVFTSQPGSKELALQIRQVFLNGGFTVDPNNVYGSGGQWSLRPGLEVMTKETPDAALSSALTQLFLELGEKRNIQTVSGLVTDLTITIGDQ